MAPSARYVGFGRRFGAAVIDSALFFAVTAPVAVPLAQRLPWSALLLDDLLPMLLVVLFWVRFGATPGKALMDCRVVVLATGEPPRWGRAVVRYLGYFVSLFTLGLGFLWILWDPRRQGFHDKLAGTVVIDTFAAMEPEDLCLERLVKEAV